MNQTGFQNLTVSTASVGLTMPTASARPRGALIYVASQPIRWRADGTDPTATVGMFVASGGYIEWLAPESPDLGPDYYGILSRVEFIRDTTATGDATLDVAYFD